jgi:hypothetical protein
MDPMSIIAIVLAALVICSALIAMRDRRRYRQQLERMHLADVARRARERGQQF